MLGRGLLVLTMLCNCVLSLPLTAGQLENEDVKVMKCIVEALADVLSRPRPLPVSQECLVTLRTDDRLVSILRHHNFLKELQEIAVRGHEERARLQGDAGTPDPTTLTPQTASDAADRSMVEALGGPGERSILSQKRRTGNGVGAEEKDESLGDEASQEATDTAEEEQEKRADDKKPRSHISESEYESRAENSEEDEEENEKKRGMKESSEENMTKDKDAGSGEKSDAPRNKSKTKFEEEEEEEEEVDKRSAFSSHKQQKKLEEQEENEDEETKRGNKESLKRWARRGKASPLTRKGVEKEEHEPLGQEEVPHHSKEASEEEEEEEKRHMKKSPEEKELQTIAGRGPEERRGSEEEGSASRRSEEPEIEGLAAIESELEDVAQRLHDLRQG